MTDDVLGVHYKDAARIIREIEESSITDEQWFAAMALHGIDLDAAVRPELKQEPGGGAEGE